ncbi:pyridine nucleotide transhydrogenase [Paenibacillus sp. 2TAB23]|uniref:pyridine nucleotide transhydrogenase n=1 Tax=Paenibacillus sp. 2TAB23 TaxID=3233004 RepID=UPI003F9D466D
MKTALIGFTGFVGTTLLSQTTFDECYNSKNIKEIRGMDFDLVVCAGAPAVKWKANQHPEEDLANLEGLMSHLNTIKAKKFVLISTVDVYQSPLMVDEETEISEVAMESYGKHRYLLEKFVQNKFERSIIVRLPGLFGIGLKKNFIFDLIHDNCLHLTHYKSIFQFYDMSRLWNDLNVVMGSDVSVINFATEPVSAEEIARNCFSTNYTNDNSKVPVNYDMRSKYAGLFGKSGPYMNTKEEIFLQVKQFVNNERETR